MSELREQKAAELAEKEAELAGLQEELGKLQDKSYRAKQIEAHLAIQYAVNQRQHPIDRSQELEIVKTIKEKKDAVERELNGYRREIDLRDKRFQKVSADIRRRTWKWKEAEKQINKLEKISDQNTRESKKDCVNELKRLFGELEVDIKRFHKKGISKALLLELVQIMKTICNEGGNLGTIPMSYHQKVYKWEQIAKDLPDDLERVNREKEAAARKKIEDELTKQNQKMSKAKKEISTLKRKITEGEKKLEEKRLELSKAEAEHPVKKQRIIDKADDQKSQLDQTLEAIRATKESIEAKMENDQTQIAAQQDEKRKLEKELEQTFVFAFGRKKELGEKISAMDVGIASLQMNIQQQLTQRDSLLRSAAKTEKKMETIQNDTTKKLETVARELKALKKEAFAFEEAISVFQAQLEALETIVGDTKKEIAPLEESLKDFHVDYLIKTHGKEVSTQAAGIKRKITEATKAVKQLQQEIKKIDQDALKAQKMLQKELTKKALEAQREKQAQQERQERIQGELQAKEEEQATIAAKAVSLVHMEAYLQEFERDPDHPLLQAESCPLTDDGKRVITNSIVRKQYSQKRGTPDCGRYLLLFVDANGKAISEQRLINQKALGETTDTSFELKADGGFHEGNYYLLILNFDTGDILSAERYQVKIAFANDFDL